MKLAADPRKMADWQIAEAAEERMKPFDTLAEELGLEKEERIPMGRRLGKIDFVRAMRRIEKRPVGKYINVTAITPTPLGEGKTTTTLGLIQGLGRLGQRAGGAIRQPSGGPTFNIKGSAAGGGLAQCLPLTELSLGLTGDIDAIVNAHNLAMVALTARMQHERNYDDARLARSRLRRLDIDPERVESRWVMDFCAQSLRNIRIGLGGKADGFEMNSGFAIAVSSEIMAILAVADSLRDLRERMSRIVLAYNRRGEEVTTADLEVDGAMTAWMVNAVNPNLLQTIEGQPILVHAGPFANIAIGQSSIIADRLGTRLTDYHVTESGFGADIGYEKFWNLKCRMSGLVPDAVVIVATVRALKMHGGGPPVRPGMRLDEAYTRENTALLEKGCENLLAHIRTVQASGAQPVVCVNGFHTDTAAETALIRRVAEAAGARCAVSEHWLRGGAGAEELAHAVMAACAEKNEFRFLYAADESQETRIDRIARVVYGGDGATYSSVARRKLERHRADPATAALGTCMVKTHLSLSHDPELKNAPRDWTLPVSDVLVYKGAGFLVPVAGAIKLMPGTASDPAYRNIDVDVETGQVRGLF
jgi:formate--tetrahydrofolate ligase